jgi:hypothetical protein
MVEPLRHRQTKEAATAMFDPQPPRHISTLHQAANPGCPHSQGGWGGNQTLAWSSEREVATDRANEAWYRPSDMTPTGGSHGNPHRAARIHNRARRCDGSEAAPRARAANASVIVCLRASRSTARQDGVGPTGRPSTESASNRKW